MDAIPLLVVICAIVALLAAAALWRVVGRLRALEGSRS